MGSRRAGQTRRIWVDLANSPQVLFFRPLIRLWAASGCEVLVTSRPFAQTGALASSYGIAHTPVGRHGGPTLAGLAGAIGERAWRLARWARGRGIDVAVSHNSYAQLVAARLLGVPAATTMDYEFQPANHLAFRLARRVVVPQAFPEPMLRRFGGAGKAHRYPGIKEQVYLSNFAPTPRFRERHGLREDAVLAVVRPAAEWALYHRGMQNPLVDELLERLAAHDEVQIVFLPRIAAQAESARRIAGSRVVVPADAWDGPSLLAAADVVISAGGTMVREAAVLGTPAFSLFAGPRSAVDQYLSDQGRLTFIVAPADLSALSIRRRTGSTGPLSAPGDVLATVADLLLGAVGDGS